MTNDVYTPYETGLRALLRRLGGGHARYAEALTYQQRLAENVAAARRYGDTEARRAGRAEIVDRLNALALEALGASYSALCRPDDAPREAAPPLGGDPLALLAAAMQARLLLLVWAEVPFPPAEHPPRSPAEAIDRWQEQAEALPPLPFDFRHGAPWPLARLLPLTILSLDPTDRVERAFRYAGVPLAVVRTRRDIVARDRHSLLKLGGDLERRSGLLLSREDVRIASNDPDKAHLLREARRAVQGGAALVTAPEPGEAFGPIWHALLAWSLGEARHSFALGPASFDWPVPLVRLEAKIGDVLTTLADRVIPPPLESPEAESLRLQLAEARENLRLIEERASEYVMSTDVPLQLVKERRRLRKRIAELERRLGPDPDGERL
jgi:hypothetical protein